jgi:hypothetical protein
MSILKGKYPSRDPQFSFTDSDYSSTTSTTVLPCYYNTDHPTLLQLYRPLARPNKRHRRRTKRVVTCSPFGRFWRSCSSCSAGTAGTASAQTTQTDADWLGASVVRPMRCPAVDAGSLCVWWRYLPAFQEMLMLLLDNRCQNWCGISVHLITDPLCDESGKLRACSCYMIIRVAVGCSCCDVLRRVDR